jgi:hypothetical protein
MWVSGVCIVDRFSSSSSGGALFAWPRTRVCFAAEKHSVLCLTRETPALQTHFSTLVMNAARQTAARKQIHLRVVRTLHKTSLVLARLFNNAESISEHRE